MEPVISDGYGEMVCPSRTYRGGRLGSEYQPLRQQPECFGISSDLVVESGNVQPGGKPVAEDGIELVHPACHGSCRIFPVADVLEKCSGSVPSFSPL